MLKKHYGVTEGQKGGVGRVRAKSLGIYDSLNNIMIKTKLPNGTEEHLSTNLSEEELNENEARELYFTRWSIEKSFDIIK